MPHSLRCLAYKNPPLVLPTDMFIRTLPYSPYKRTPNMYHYCVQSTYKAGTIFNKLITLQLLPGHLLRTIPRHAITRLLPRTTQARTTETMHLTSTPYTEHSPYVALLSSL